MAEPALFNAILRRDLATFIAQCFATLEPGTAYRPNWHIHAIAWQLQRVRRGDCKRLIITVPPRSAKSICVTIAFTAWVMGQDPRKRIMAISYANELSLTHAAGFRSVVTSDWYRELFPGFSISANRGQEIRTSQQGYRFAGSVGGSVLGRGADLIVIDDPINGLEAATSAAARRRVQEFYDTTLYSRLNDRLNGAIIIVMQRLHEDDLVGHVLEKEDWDVLSIPAIAEIDQSYRIGEGAEALYHRKVGEVLHPGRDTHEWLAAAKRNLGTLHFSAQYQQNPLPSEGQIIKRDWLRYCDERPSRFDFVIASWDTASTQAEHSDWSVGTVWGAVGQTYYLIDLVRGRWEAPQLRRKMIELAQKHAVDATLIEDTELGRALSQDLRRSRALYPLLQQSRVEKTARLMAQAARFEAGQVFLPQQADWLAGYLSELLAFPLARHDDQVDATSQALKHLTARTPIIRQRPQSIVRQQQRARP
ncbi:phage terminase large subunit [Bosea sp. NBC_00550]|uniref:phage terminase large subunit n=1 Tax=Bosea sp. NBC_00550 TaxID=2969621 RepID=UPI0022303537|nr:phage terminase large subunit [Bosea sp. NBC_00550]UZF91318.1 phage terminase large subunit [Bosea sp. NBC_00550]